MRFEVYCDESFPDLLSSRRPKFKHLMIGSLWIPKDLRTPIKEKIKELRSIHNIHGEIKWHKISNKSLSFYQSIIDIFVDSGGDVRFRCIAIDRTQVNMSLLQNDPELGFYKFYYQLLHHWILDFNEYSIFCDIKTNRDIKRLEKLHECLSNSNLSSQILNVQSLPSEEVVLIQMADLLLGCASCRLNQTITPGSVREKLVLYLEEKLRILKICETPKKENKFNVFNIKLTGGWND